MRAILALATVGLLVSTVAHASTVRFGGTTNATFGVTSRFNNSTTPVSDEQITFGPPNTTNVASCDAGGFVEIVDGPNGYNLSTPAQDQVALHQAPTTGNSCYLHVTDQGAQPDPSALTGYTDIFFPNDAFTARQRVFYLGFLWGSPDRYNYFQLLDINGNVVNNTFGGLDTNANNALDGNEIYSRYGFSGALVNAGIAAEQYVNLILNEETVFGIRVGANGNCCTEIDNLTFSISAAVSDPTPGVGVPSPTPTAEPTTSVADQAIFVPEPGAGIALIAGLGLLGMARRRRA